MFQPDCKSPNTLNPVKSILTESPLDIPHAVDGAPTAIEIFAPRFRDEDCLEAIRIIDRDIKVLPL